MDDQIIIHSALYYVSVLAFPYLFWLGFRLWKKRQFTSVGGVVFLLGILFVWARFIEPQLLITQSTSIPDTQINTDIVLIADLHIGVYKSPRFLERVVNKVNTIPASFNVIAGDFVYEVDADQLDIIFAPLKQLNRPTYIVLGNHDSETEGLKEALLRLNLIDIEQKVIDMGAYQIGGVGDRWDYNDKIRFSPETNKPLIVVAHNPDSATEFNQPDIKMILSGHTHCGQMRIPLLYKKVIPSEFGYDCGLEQAQTAAGTRPIFITAGTGEIALPMRLFNPPTIDLIRLRP